MYSKLVRTELKYCAWFSALDISVQLVRLNNAIGLVLSKQVHSKLVRS